MKPIKRPRRLVLLRSFPVILVLAVLLSSCASVQVSQDYKKDYSFTTEKTYGWNETLDAENGDLLDQDELLAKRFKEAVQDVLFRKGFRQVNQPEFLISYTYTVTSRLQVEPWDTNFGFGYGRYGRYGRAGIYSGNSIRQYDQGKFVFNIHSARTQELLWKGTGTREVFTHSTPDQITRNVNEIVEAVLAQFPPLNSSPRN
ncbi:MAG: DUF4136 domain-containing protein [Desulforhopalus sp.]